MQLANDTTTVELDGASYTLRPSLRAALTLARTHDSFASLAAKVLDFDISTVHGILNACGDYRGTLADLTKALITPSLLQSMASLQPALLAFIIKLASADEANTGKPDPKAKPIPFTEHFERLFEIGTGTLGWSPADTWQATPKEIIVAYKGRCDLLRMIFGGGDETKANHKALSLDDKAKLAFANLGIKKAA